MTKDLNRVVVKTGQFPEDRFRVIEFLMKRKGKRKRKKRNGSYLIPHILHSLKESLRGFFMSMVSGVDSLILVNQPISEKATKEMAIVAA